jgi:predicted ArsR family transcriptional regulator
MQPRPTTELTDARAMRAYAHPTRLALVSLLRREGPKTATQAAQAIGESVASCSFHLRQLAKYGLIEQVPGEHGREKPWRSAALSTSWRNDSPDPDTAAAAAHLDAVILDRYHERARDWLTRREHESMAWRRAADNSDYVLYLTPAELRKLTEQIRETMAPYQERLTDASQRPKGSRPVTLIQLSFPGSQS